MPRLNIFQDGKFKDSISLEYGQKVKIGSLSDNDLVLVDKQVSRYHAEIRPSGNDFLIVDLKSTNGVMVKNTPIRECALQDGDEIKIGRTQLVYQKCDDNPMDNPSFSSAGMGSLSMHSVLIAQQLSSFLARSEPSSKSDIDERAAIDRSVKQLQKGLDDLEKSYEKLSTLYEVSQNINSTLDLKRVLSIVMDSVIKVSNADRGFIMLADPKTNTLIPAIARGMGGKLDKDEQSVSLTIAKKSFSDRIPVLTADAIADERFKDEQSVMGLSLRSVICVPLICRERAMGVIYLDNSQEKGTFSEGDLNFLQTFANQAAVALENARLHKDLIEKKKYERELELARQIQSNMLPRSCPIIRDISIGATCIPAKVVGGDYYDFLLHELDRDKIGFLIADVSGKGVPAALVLATARSIVHTACKKGSSPSSVLTTLNELLSKDLYGSMFITVFLGFLDINSQEFTYAKAGHNPTLLIHESGNTSFLDAPGIPCGLFENGGYQDKSIRLEKGDRLIFYTDGLTEATNEKGELFENERLISSALRGKNQEATAHVHQIIGDIIKFRGKAPQSDDLTLLIVGL